MMQGRTAADEWEASSRQGILESVAEEESPREGPHPLRTADWKLEASQDDHIKWLIVYTWIWRLCATYE